MIPLYTAWTRDIDGELSGIPTNLKVNRTFRKRCSDRLFPRIFWPSITWTIAYEKERYYDCISSCDAHSRSLLHAEGETCNWGRASQRFIRAAETDQLKWVYRTDKSRELSLAEFSCSCACHVGMGTLYRLIPISSYYQFPWKVRDEIRGGFNSISK